LLTPSQLRAFLYLVHVAIEGDVSVQHKGMLRLCATRSPFKVGDFDRILTKRLYHILTYVPLRVVAYHITFTSHLSASLLDLFLPNALWLMGPDVRLRYKLHPHKQDKQMQESFATYGITELPFAAGGTHHFDGDAWLSERHRVEALVGQRPNLSHSFVLDSVLGLEVVGTT
jgi:hypothetical protein